MSPRLARKPAAHHHEAHTADHVGELASHDRDRKVEDALHHSENHMHPQHHPVLPPIHDTHAHLHGEDLPTHTNKPSPIKPSKKLTRTGSKK